MREGRKQRCGHLRLNMRHAACNHASHYGSGGEGAVIPAVLDRDGSHDICDRIYCRTSKTCTAERCCEYAHQYYYIMTYTMRFTRPAVRALQSSSTPKRQLLRTSAASLPLRRHFTHTTQRRLIGPPLNIPKWYAIQSLYSSKYYLLSHQLVPFQDTD